jgi:hypothetical protein
MTREMGRGTGDGGQGTRDSRRLLPSRHVPGFAVARWAIVAGVLALAGCDSKPVAQAKDTLTTRQRQERVGAMPIPGAKGVTRALGVQDSGAARARLIDSAGSER